MLNFVVISTLISLFTEAFYVTRGFDIKLFYFVILFNAALMVRASVFSFDRRHLGVLLGLFVVGGIGVLQGYGTPINFLQQIIGISIVSLYYRSFSQLIAEQADKVFRWYVLCACVLAWIGVAISAYQYYRLGQWIRLESIMNEPAHFSLVVLPAYHYAMARFIRDRTHGRSAIALLISLLLAGSSVGFIGMMLSLVLLLGLNRIKLALAPLLLALVFSGLYVVSEDFKRRVDDTVSVVVNGTVANVNISTYVLVKNTYVALESVKRSPLWGSGLGSHELSTRIFLPNNSQLMNYKQGTRLHGGVQALNARDANSLLLRLASELGFIGVFAVVWFVAKFWIKGDPISDAIFVYLCMKLFRDGHYFPPEMYFFVFFYVLMYQLRRVGAAPITPIVAETIPPSRE